MTVAKRAMKAAQAKASMGSVNHNVDSAHKK